MKKSMLGEYITGYSVKNKKDEDIPVYSVTNDRGFCTEYFSKDVSGKDKKNYKIVPRGYFAYNPSRINVGSVDWQNCEDRVIVSPLYVVFKTDERLEQEYLKYYLKSDIGRYYINESAVGAVRANLKLDILSKFRLPIPDIEEQRKIVSQLKLIDELIELKEKEIEIFYKMVKSRFVEMFGTLNNPVQCFRKVALNDLCNKITDGKHGGCKTEKGTKRYFVGAREIYSDIVHYDTAPEINISEFEKDYKRCNVEKGDFLIVNTGATIGKSAIALDNRTEHTLLQKSVALLKVKHEQLNPVFLKWCYTVNTNMYMVESASAQPNLLLSKIKATVIYVPDMNLQNQFADFVQQVDKSKIEAQKAIDKLKILQKNLLQKYFC